MSSDANTRGVVELSASTTSSVVPPSIPQDSSGKPVEDPPTRSKTTSSTVWSYAKQPWSSKGFSRVFSKVFGPSKEEAEKTLPTADTAPIPRSATQQVPSETPRSDPEPPRKDPFKVVDCSDVDLTVENQDIAVQTLMSLKRQPPSQANKKPRARKKSKSTSVVPNATEHSVVVDGRTQPGPKQNALNVPAREVLYRPLSVNDLVTQRQEIQSASALVTRTLLSGSYPSPYQASGSSENEEASALHATHRSAVCASLEKFTNDIIIPSFVGELHSTLVPEEATEDDASILYTKGHRTLDAKAKGSRHNQVLRAFYGTLLLLREVLVQNFDNVFGPNAASGLLLEAPMAASVEEEDSEIESLAKQIFVTAIILTGIAIFFGSDGDDDSRDQSEELIQAFFKCIEKYDRGHKEFADCLPLVDDRTVAVFPNQQPMNPVERVAWQLSCNFQRSLHPLYHHHRLEHDLFRPSTGEEEQIDEGTGRQRRVLKHVPTPTAVHISILKIQSKSSAADAPL